MKSKIILCVFLCCISCNRDVENISIEGIITSKTSELPIENILIKITCYSYADSPDQSYTEEKIVIVKTDATGFYSTTFVKGAFLILETRKVGYKNDTVSLDLSRKKNTINISLTSAL